ncbi:MAG: DegQ family serine endoprotease [Minwuiales bacterium]|nr:DegQ family serine endoprotease [Minwuiales bacterium]
MPARRAGQAGAVALAAMVATAAVAQARPMPVGFADLVDEVAPSVVNVSVTVERNTAVSSETERQFGQNSPFDGTPFEEFFKRYFNGHDRQGRQATPQQPQRPASGVGSGFIIDPDGYVVTNNHVVGRASEIEVTLNDGETFDATLVGRDQRTDLALLKIEADEPLPYVEFGDSDKARVGDWVLAVGNPFGLGGTVTAGIISADGRDLRDATLVDFLQIDAPINRGNSGGPSFNKDGEVIGVNTAIYSPTGGSIGIGFAIPSNLAEKVVDQLRETGKVARGWIGVRIQPVTDDIARSLNLDKAQGALVASVEAESPAEKAGFKSGDVVLEWDGEKVEDMRDLPRLVADTAAGDKTEIKVWRDGKAKSLSVTPGDAPIRPKLAAAEQPPKANVEQLGKTGVAVANLTDETRQRFDIPNDVSGVVIAQVDEASAAAESGLRVGDVVSSIALDPVEDAKQAANRFDTVTAGKQPVVLLKVLREGASQFIVLRVA